ncbi:MAG: transglycosylase domain-containing protein [Oscillospiraceae bacterium]
MSDFDYRPSAATGAKPLQNQPQRQPLPPLQQNSYTPGGRPAGQNAPYRTPAGRPAPQPYGARPQQPPYTAGAAPRQSAYGRGQQQNAAAGATPRQRPYTAASQPGGQTSVWNSSSPSAAAGARPSSRGASAGRAGGPPKGPSGRPGTGRSTGGGGNGGNGGGRRSRQPSAGKLILTNLLKVFFALFCLGVIVASVFAVRVATYVVSSTENDSEILNLETFSQSATSYIMALNPNNPNAEAENDWIEYQKLTGESNSIWVPLDEIPTYIQDAAIAAEDADFYNNSLGFSIPRTIYAALNEVFHFRATFGGSTLDQQLVKNLTKENEVVGEGGDTSAGYQRKLREIYRAWSMNKNYTKPIILETYLNTIPLSGTIVGVQAGAKEYYNKNLNELTLAQCATIVGITNAPGKYNPYTNPENCLERRDYVLYRMLVTEKITQQEYDAAIAEGLGLYEGEREGNSTGVFSYFTDTVYEAVISDYMEQHEGISRQAAHRLFYNSGWRIYATVDLTLQTEMERVYEMGYGSQSDGYIFPDISAEVQTKDESGNVISTETKQTQSAMVVMDYQGNLRGVVGGIGEKTESLGQNRATQSYRQVGSTMKPIAAYALGIEEGMVDYSSMLEDSPVQYKNPSNPVVDENGLPVYDWPSNYTNTYTRAPMLVSDALAQSINTVAVKIGMRVGIDRMYEFLVETLQVSTLTDDGIYTDRAIAPLVLGSMTHGMYPIELASAYQMFGNGGVYYSWHCYSKILDANGNLVMQPNITVVQAISEETSYVMNRLLENVLSRSAGTATGVNGTANGMKPSGNMDAVGKTGTTSDDKDRWFVGLTPYYVSAVWWGYDDNAELEWSARASTNPPPLVWKTVMETAQANLAYKEFPAKPAGVQEATFCRETGQLATENCTDTQTGYYTSNRVPETCYLHGTGATG